MKNLFYNRLTAFAAASILLLTACEKNNFVVDQDALTPDSYAKFNTIMPADTIAVYYINSTNNVFKLPVGVTNVSNQDRTVNFTYSSNSATMGDEYTAPASLTIPAGQAVDSLVIQGNYAAFGPSEIDTVTITIQGSGDIAASTYKQRYHVVMRRFCDETQIDINTFAGVYNNTIEVLANATTGAGTPYGPYTTTVSSITMTGATTARIAVENIFDDGWGPIEFNLDWTNPNDRQVRVIAQAAIPGSDAGSLNGAYAGIPVAIRPHSNGQIGTFSVCDNRLVLVSQLGVSGVGWFSNIYRVTMNR